MDRRKTSGEGGRKFMRLRWGIKNMLKADGNEDVDDEEAGG